MEYTVYTDGACSGNPGPGGYAFVVISDKEEPLVVSGHKEKTTNNHMELMAIVKSLRHITKRSAKTSTEVTIYSDSAYCINSIIYGWVNFWAKNGWKTKGGDEVKNKELWDMYMSIVKENPKLKLVFVKVKGHAGDEYNELADRAARDAIRKA